MVVGKILVEGVRFGSRYFPKTILAIKRTDVRIHKSLYGASGGKGVRHGRDLGSIGAGLYQGTRSDGDELDQHAVQTPSEYVDKTSSKFKARGGYQRRRDRCPPKRNRFSVYRR